MTPTEIETAARQRYNAVGDDFFPQEMVMDLIYGASLEMGLEAYPIEKVFETTSVADQQQYTYPTQMVGIRRIEYNGLKINPVDLDDDPKQNTTGPTGRPYGYSIWADVIRMYPTPDTTGKTIKIFGFNEPQRVSTDSVLEIPTEYHLDIVDYILSAFFAKDKDRNMSTYHRDLWAGHVRKSKRDRAKRKRTDRFAVVKQQEYTHVGNQVW